MDFSETVATNMKMIQRTISTLLNEQCKCWKLSYKVEHNMSPDFIRSYGMSIMFGCFLMRKPSRIRNEPLPTGLFN